MRNIIEKINRIEDLYNQSAAEQGEKMMDCLDNPIALSYFLRRLSGHFNIGWFMFAYHKGFLSFDQIPQPVQYENAGGEISFGFKNWEGVYPIMEAAKVMPENTELSKVVLSLVNKYIALAKERKDDQNRNFTVDYHISRIILLLPLKNLEEKHLNFVFNFGLGRDRSILSRELINPFFDRALKEDHDLAMKLLDFFYSPVRERRMHRVHSKIDEYALENFSKSAPASLYSELGEPIVRWVLNKLKEVSTAEKVSFSKFEISSLEPDTQNSNESGYGFSLVRLAIGLLSNLPNDKLFQVTEILIDSTQQILSRIAFYLVDQDYDNLSALFWKQENPLNKSEAKLEIFRLIKRNCLKFDDNKVERLTYWIETLSIEKINEQTEEEAERHTAYRKLEWYIALEAIHYRYSELLIQPYNKLRKITDGQLPAHPGYDSYFSVLSGGDYSYNNRILGKPAIEVLNILANKERWEGYNIYGLQQDIRDYVLASFSEVFENLKVFESIPMPFVYNFIDGFRGIAEKGETLNVQILLDFINGLINKREDMWNFSVDAREKSSSIGMIAWTLKTIVNNEDYSLKMDEVKQAITTLIKMEQFYTLEFTWLNHDPINDIINSTRGHIYGALMSCSFRAVKVQGTGPYWDRDVKELFSKRLQEHSGSTEFYWTVGFNVPQISYLDMNWLETNKTLLLEYKEPRYDCPVFYGYLLFSRQLYTNLFDFFYKTYLDQVQILIDDSAITRRLIEHVWVAFAIDRDGSAALIDAVLSPKSEQQLSFLIDRIKTENGVTKGDKIRYVWNSVLAIADISGSKALGKKVSEMVYFTELLNDFTTEDLKLFTRTLSLSNADINTYRLLKVIEDKLNEGNYDLAGQLLEVTLNRHSEDDYFDDQKLVEIIEVLYKNDRIDLADRIAIATVERKNFSIVGIYNKYHGQM